MTWLNALYELSLTHVSLFKENCIHIFLNLKSFHGRKLTNNYPLHFSTKVLKRAFINDEKRDFIWLRNREAAVLRMTTVPNNSFFLSFFRFFSFIVYYKYNYKKTKSHHAYFVLLPIKKMICYESDYIQP